MSIQILPPEVAGQIAAGEVVERPANVVKELIENSLDADAREIRVEIQEGGRRLIRVTDDGHGIPREELPLALHRHATSKLQTAEDLGRIRTYGFRGEALHSIAAVSHLVLSSRHRDAETGFQLRAEGGTLTGPRPVGMPVGTVVSVEHLFFNVPARRKFLRRPATEAGHITAIVQRYALAHPHRRFILLHDGRPTFQSTGSGRRWDVLVAIYGLESAQQMVPLQEEAPPEGPLPGPGQPPRVYGYISLPTLTRASRTHIDLFVNRRYVEDRSLTHAVVQAYHTWLPVGRFPVAALFVDLDPGDVDVNVHPRKTEIRLREGRRVFGAVQKAVRRALLHHTPIPGLAVGPDLPTPDASSAPRPLPLEREDRRLWSQRRRALLQAGRGLPGRQGPPSPTPETGAEALPEPPQARTAPEAREAEGLPPLRVVGQVAGMYIVAEGPEGLYLIDQHAAHERILYERLMAQRAGGQVARQGLLEPLVLHMGHVQAGLIAEHLEALNALGFEIEAFGEDAFRLRAVPAILAHQDPARTLEEILQGLAQERNRVGEALEAALVRTICKRAAIKAGQILSDIEMVELVRQLESCRSPRTCPHGRPTMLRLSAQELERAFGRT